MALTILLNGTPTSEGHYITWSPAPLTLSSTDTTSRTVRLRGESDGPGRIHFRIDEGTFSDEIEVTIPANGQPLTLSVAGKFPNASSSDRDVAIVVVDASTQAELGRLPLMVRVRKNADSLSSAERDRFLSALVRLNTPDEDGYVPFLELQNMHVANTDREIHRRASFLPWHRAYILDLERRLQRIEPSVALPFWRFDRPAPNVFTRDFLGVPVDDDGVVDYSATNPLINWIDRLNGSSSPRVRRFNGSVFEDENGQLVVTPFDPTQSRAIEVVNGQDDTVNLGRPRPNRPHSFAWFARMENDPHGSAHVSFNGQIRSPATAPADPLFFLLHCNVDRLWARWQWLAERWSLNDPRAYPFQGNGAHGVPPGNEAIGNFTLDTLWPWDGDTQPPRPNAAPGGVFPRVFQQLPSQRPTLGEMIDYQGQLSGGPGLGFAYEDVPLET